jgi:hypothetical protein
MRTIRIAALVASCLAAFGQSRGAISGEILDASGASVPHGKIQVNSPAIGLALKLQLELGQLSEKVEVTAEAPLVETSNGEFSRMVTQEQLQDFSLPGRNPFYTLGIMPGAASRYGDSMTGFRGGSRDLHVSAYEFFFSEAFAAQQDNVGGKPRIRYHNYGITAGGPVYFPGKWNTEENGLFFW